MTRKREIVSTDALTAYAWRVPSFSAAELLKRVGIKGKCIPDADVIVESLDVKDGDLHVQFAIVANIKTV